MQRESLASATTRLTALRPIAWLVHPFQTEIP
ncbi:hypothetical protein BJB45_01225 [Halomonas huangheensis]|uniref:Uncharacterized protein n=1 Tax=Halomonas huangheensis TaxID=1178482 RepID=W1N2Q9_9GAMM|nr:hypothetical protein BJB45_01225 [Halomonas huangheensis]